MRRRTFLAATMGILVVTACVGSDPDTTRAGPGDGTDAGGACAGDQPTACGPSCTKCPEPTGGGRATCTAGTCGVACDGAKTACGAACIDLASDADNCGRCGRKCGAGSSCSDARCATQVVEDVPTPLQEIVIAGPNVYYSTPSEIRRVAKSGGVSEKFHAGPIGNESVIRDRTLAADAQKLYWGGTQSGIVFTEAIFEQALGGMTSTAIARYQNGSTAAVSGNLAAWSLNGNTIYACAPGAACAGETDGAKLLRAGATGLEFLAISGANVVWTEHSGPGTGTVFLSKQADDRIALAQTAHPFHLVVHDGALYWTDLGSDDQTTKPGVWTCKVAGCAGTPTRLVEWDAAPARLAVDESGVYFAVPGSAASPTGAIVVCRDVAGGCTGTTKPEVLVQGAERPDGIAIDATDVFFATHPTVATGKVLRVAK